MVSAGLMRWFRTSSARVRYWKPIQTGIEQDDDTREVARLAECTDAEIFNAGIRLPRPLSPHLAAQLSGTRIDLDAVISMVPGDSDTTTWIVEGAGGVLVPINESHLMIDLMSALRLPVVVAARTRLGTINHTLLTIEALRQRALTIAGIVMVGEPDADNRAAIETYGKVRVAGELPMLDPLTPESLVDNFRIALGRTVI
ncbi:MAG TPA: dethiobiotin synthase [Vicinamibacterales bacterium]|nr:dethiobiotin synthase [Vicinamibacterales bacterium]